MAIASTCSGPALAERVVIDRLGARGDGLAMLAGASVHVPYALPGETVRIEHDGPRGRLVEVEIPGPERTEPFCPYFARCGGCAAQHMGVELYRGWKRGLVANALGRVGIGAESEPLVDAHGAGRRRVTFHARFAGRAASVGYMAARSHDLVEIAFCPIAEPALRESPAVARAIADLLAGSNKPLDIGVTASEVGFDIDIRGHGPLRDADRRRLIRLAGELDLARLSLHGEVVVERRPPLVTFGTSHVVPPPGAFLQATRAGEQCLADLVIEACGTARRVADLFAGCGPFALRLAAKREVHAVEHDARSLAALDRAARETSGLRRVTTEARDLFRRPLLAPDLARFDAIVLDPPRAGAEAQMKQLARASVPIVASVSCDPATFARDGAILLAGGYALERVVLVDQFKYTPHVEMVGVFRRPAQRRR